MCHSPSVNVQKSLRRGTTVIWGLGLWWKGWRDELLAAFVFTSLLEEADSLREFDEPLFI